MTIDGNSRLGPMVEANPRFACVLERHKLDFCSQGKQTLSDACLQRGVDPNLVLAELKELEAKSPDKNWKQAPLCELVEHIQKTYHQPLRLELPSLEERAKRVAMVHGSGNPKLHEIEELVSALCRDLLFHTEKEDKVLFPWICDLEKGLSRQGRLSAPMSVMESEHDEAEEVLEALRAATRNYSLPEGACTTYRLLFAGLRRLDDELQQHISLENSVLFPRALALPGA